MKRLITLFLIAVLACSAVPFISQPEKAEAAPFNRNNLIDDATFDNVNSMSAAHIDDWLNTFFPNSCISTNSGFSAVLPTGYSPSGGFTYGGYATAGTVIATAAQTYGLNPQVLLATLQKEQSLVAGGVGYCENGDAHKYAAAVGYGCPDGGTRYNYTGVNLYRRHGVVVSSVNPTCVNSASKAGFSQQVIRAAWLLKFGEQRSKGNTSWAIIRGSWDNSDDPLSCYGGAMTTGNYKRCSHDASTTFYDGYTVIDGVSTHMDSGATAALYWYTPHVHGNQNFVSLFTSWFGSQYSNDTTVAHPNGTLVHNPNGIYLISDNTRRFFSWPQVIDSYGYDWRKIKQATTGDMSLPAGADLNKLAPGTVFKSTDSSTRYVMDYDTDDVLKKRVITDYAFAQLGYNSRDVITVPPYVIPSETFATALDEARHPSGTLILFYGIPIVYVVDDGVLRPVQNELAFDSHNFRMSNLKGGTQFDSWMPRGDALKARQGTIVLNSQGISVIDYDGSGNIMARPFGPWECYSNRMHYTSYDWVNNYQSLQLPTNIGSLFSC